MKKSFSRKEWQRIRQIAREFWEELGLIFAHNLSKGWERKILAAGKVLSKNGRRELKTFQEIKAALGENGQV